MLAPTRPILAGGQEGQEAGKGGAPLGGASDNAPRLRLLAPYSPAAKKTKKRIKNDLSSESSD